VTTLTGISAGIFSFENAGIRLAIRSVMIVFILCDLQIYRPICCQKNKVLIMYGLHFGMGAGVSRNGKVYGILGKLRYAMWKIRYRRVK
jgi:hypothetical protein